MLTVDMLGLCHTYILVIFNVKLMSIGSASGVSEPKHPYIFRRYRMHPIMVLNSLNSLIE